MLMNDSINILQQHKEGETAEMLMWLQDAIYDKWTEVYSDHK
jgi:hypothetical protein